MHKIFNIVRAIVQEVGWSDGNEDVLPGEGRERRRGGERERERGGEERVISSPTVIIYKTYQCNG